MAEKFLMECVFSGEWRRTRGDVVINSGNHGEDGG